MTNMKSDVLNSLMCDNLYVQRVLLRTQTLNSYSYEVENDLNHTDLVLKLGLTTYYVDIKRNSTKHKNSQNFSIPIYSDEVFNQPNALFAFIDESDEYNGHIYLVSKQTIGEYVKDKEIQSNAYWLIEKSFVRNVHMNFLAFDLKPSGYDLYILKNDSELPLYNK